MTLNEYFRSEPYGSRKEMADYLGITQNWMSIITRRPDLCSPSLAKAIEKATQGLVPASEMRPDIFN